MKRRWITLASTCILLLIALTAVTHLQYRESDTALHSSVNNSAISFSFEKPTWLHKHPKEKTITKYVRNQYQNIANGAEKFQKDFPDSALLPYQLKVDATRIITGEYESILITDYRFTGGAHGNTTYTHHNLENGKDITLREYLREMNVSEKELLIRVNKTLLNDSHSTIKTLTNTPWQIQTKNKDSPLGIKLIFPPYAVASYAEGTITYSF